MTGLPSESIVRHELRAMSGGRFQFTVAALGIAVTALAVYAAVLARLRPPYIFACFAVPVLTALPTFLAMVAPRHWRTWLLPTTVIIGGLAAFACGLWLRSLNR